VNAAAISLRRGSTSDPATSVALIRPPVVVPVQSVSFVAPMPPIGLAYIAAALRAAGHQVDVIDAPGEALDQLTDFATSCGTMRRIGLTLDDIVARIPSGVKVVGITHMFLHEWPTIRDLAELVKERHPDAFVVLGGENATAYRDWILDESAAVDCCVLGEGEATVVQLADRIAAGAPLGGLRGVALGPSHPERTDVPAELPARIRALATVPRPAWDLFPMENYFRHQVELSEALGRSIPMLATRGCPYKCSFCSSPKMWTTRYLVREPEELVDEIADHVARYSIDCVEFVDLTAMTKRNWMLALCDELERRQLGVTWQLPVGTRSEGFDAHVLKRLHDAGCRSVTFAPEHGSQHMLEVFDKRLDLSHILESISDAHKVGLDTNVHTIIGHPAETRRDRWENLVFIVRTALIGCDSASAFVFHPYPGSRDFAELLEAGKLTIDEAFLYDGIANLAPGNRSWNPTLSSWSLYASQLVTKVAFELAATMRDPNRALRLVRALVSGDNAAGDDCATPADTGGPIGLRFGDERDTRAAARWIRSQMRFRGWSDRPRR
jgi:radical SAM superfamily enzyme YgiQ (UPF0313 family)